MRDKGIALSIIFSLFTSSPAAHPPLSKPQLTAHDYLLQQMSPKSRVTYFIFTKHVIVEHSFLGMPLMDYGLSKMSPRGSSTCKSIRKKLVGESQLFLTNSSFFIKVDVV